MNKCRVPGCYINFQGYEIGAVLILPTYEDLKRKFIAFLDRDVHSLKTQSHKS